ncbi:MAG: efflux transporter outer membrane subunit [Gammaproteobacteria bacterium]|nr:efflux transporter outer membrane subunit [Gammaproteobacteria bacterium]
MKLLRRVLVLAAAALPAACAIGPDYQRPDKVMPVQEYHGVLSPQQAESYADLDWIQAFGDPRLDELIRIALDNNLDLQIAAARVEEYRGLARVSRGAMGPQVRGTGSTVPSAVGDEDASYSLGLALSWEIDLFGKLRRASEATRALLLASEDNARAVMATLVAEVATTWIELLDRDAELDIIRRTIKLQEDSLALVQSQNRNGVASGTEVQQAMSQLATTRAQLPITEQQRVETENRLRFLLGFPPDHVASAGTPGAFPAPPDVPVGLPAQLLTRRPDLRRLENELHSATAGVGVAQASRFPYLSIALTSFFGLVSPELARLFDGKDPAQELFAIGPAFDMPIYTSGVGKGNVEAARARARQAELAYRQGVLQSLREVSDSLSAQVRLGEFIAHNEERVASSRELLRLQQMRYRSGVVSYLEVIDAERQLFAAEVDLVRARRDRLVAYVLLYRALGGGWSQPEIDRLLSATK